MAISNLGSSCISPSAKGISPSGIVHTSPATARAELMQHSLRHEHAIYQEPGKDSYVVICGEEGRVMPPGGQLLYLHTHPTPFAMPSLWDLRGMVETAGRSPGYDETLIYCTAAQHPGLSHIRYRGDNRFHVTYADGQPSATDSTTDASVGFGPHREFGVELLHNMYGIIGDTGMLVQPLSTGGKYYFCPVDHDYVGLGVQWFWGQILLGTTPIDMEQAIAVRALRLGVIGTSV